MGKTCVWNHTLRGGRDVVVSFGSGEEFVLQMVDEGIVVGPLVVLERRRVHLTLDIQIKTVDSSVTKRSWLSCCNPFASRWAESSPEKLREVLGHFHRWKVVVERPSSSDRQENLLAILVAFFDTWFNSRAAIQKLTARSIGVLEHGATAGIGEVGSWIVTNSPGKLIDKSDVDDVDAWILANLRECYLIITLAPVNGDVPVRRCIEYGRNG